MHVGKWKKNVLILSVWLEEHKRSYTCDYSRIKGCRISGTQKSPHTSTQSVTPQPGMVSYTDFYCCGFILLSFLWNNAMHSLLCLAALAPNHVCEIFLIVYIRDSSFFPGMNITYFILSNVNEHLGFFFFPRICVSWIKLVRNSCTCRLMDRCIPQVLLCMHFHFGCLCHNIASNSFRSILQFTDYLFSWV